MRELKIAITTTLWVFALAAIFGFFVLGCAAIKPGAGCSGNAAYCADPGHALACEDGKYVSYACTGPTACQATDAGVVLCDQSMGAVANTACAPPYAGLAQCSGDKSAALLCQNGTWQPLLCQAGQTCQNDGVHVWCG